MSEFLKNIKNVSDSIDDFKKSSFQAKLYVNGIYCLSDDKEYQEKSILKYNIFEYVNNCFKNYYIRIPHYGSSTGFSRKKKACSTSYIFDNVISELLKSARNDRGFEFFQMGVIME
jgi:hypothetical protein